ncbi:uncharacterized protein LOC113493351 [Trichoplusia ni]|uniref:Uncharacterized protein LOC113493351 n=1 Tax=Trichoplusia ni TaxID=7111 RepID=A0A7E5VFK2_TRINI|nr:uncharacterized protein LOC113493351 [Trichoplusia ni]
MTETTLEDTENHLPSSETQKTDIMIKIPTNNNNKINLNENIYTENNLEKDKYSQKKALGSPGFGDISTLRGPEYDYNNDQYITSKNRTHTDDLMDGINELDTTTLFSYYEDSSDEHSEHQNNQAYNESNPISTGTYQNYQSKSDIDNGSPLTKNATNNILLMLTTKTPEDSENDMDVILSTQKTTRIPMKLEPVDTTMIGSKIYLLDPYTMQNILTRGVDKNKEQLKYSTDNIFMAYTTLNMHTDNNNRKEKTDFIENITSLSEGRVTTLSLVPVETQINSFTNSFELSKSKSSKQDVVESTTQMFNIYTNPSDTINSYTQLFSQNVNEKKLTENTSPSYNISHANNGFNSIAISKNNKTNINFALKIGTADKNISYIYTPKLSKIKVTKLKPISTTYKSKNSHKDDKYFGANSKVIDDKAKNKFVKNVEDAITSNLQELLSNVQNGKLREEKGVNIFSSRIHRPSAVRASPAAVTKSIRYNTYRPTTKEDLELLKFDSQPIFNTVMYKKIYEKPHYQSQGLNKSCNHLKSLKKTFSSETEFIAALKAANCTEQTMTHNQKTYLGFPKKLTKNVRLTSKTTNNEATNGTLMSLPLMELNTETGYKHQITREINRKPPLLNFYTNSQSKLVPGNKLLMNSKTMADDEKSNKNNSPFPRVNQNKRLLINGQPNSDNTLAILSDSNEEMATGKTVLSHNEEIRSKLKINQNLSTNNFSEFNADSFELIKDTALPKNKEYSDPVFDLTSNIFPDRGENKNLLSIMDFNISGSPIKFVNTNSASVFDTIAHKKPSIDTKKVVIPTDSGNFKEVPQNKNNLFPITDLNISTISFKDSQDTQPLLEFFKNSHQTISKSTKLPQNLIENSAVSHGEYLLPMLQLNTNTTPIKDNQDNTYSYKSYGFLRNFQESIKTNNSTNVNLLPQKRDGTNLLPIVSSKISAPQAENDLDAFFNVPVGLVRAPVHEQAAKIKLDPNYVENMNYFFQNEYSNNFVQMADYNSDPGKQKNTNLLSSSGFQENPQRTMVINSVFVPNKETSKHYFPIDENGEHFPAVVTPTQGNITNLRQVPEHKTAQETLGINRNLVSQTKETEYLLPTVEFNNIAPIAIKNRSLTVSQSPVVESKQNFHPEKEVHMNVFKHKVDNEGLFPTNLQSSYGFQGNSPQIKGINNFSTQNKKDNHYFPLSEDVSPVVVNVSSTQGNNNKLYPSTAHHKNPQQTLGINKNLVLQKGGREHLLSTVDFEDNSRYKITHKNPQEVSIKNQKMVEQNMHPTKEVHMNLFTHKKDTGGLFPTNLRPSFGFEGMPFKDVPVGSNSGFVQSKKENKHYFPLNENSENVSPLIVSVTSRQDNINNLHTSSMYHNNPYQNKLNTNYIPQKGVSENLLPNFDFNSIALRENKNSHPYTPKEVQTNLFMPRKENRDPIQFNVSVSPNLQLQNGKLATEENRILLPKKEVNSNVFTHLQDNGDLLPMLTLNDSTASVKNTVTNSNIIDFLKNAQLPKSERHTHKDNNVNTPKIEYKFNVAPTKDTNSNRPTGALKSIQHTVEIPKPLLPQKEVKNNVFLHKEDNGSLFEIHTDPVKKSITKPRAPVEPHKTRQHIVVEKNKKPPFNDIPKNTVPGVNSNRNLHKNIVNKNIKQMNFNKGSLLSPFGKLNSFASKIVPPPKVPIKPMKRMKLGNRRMEVMTMNTQDFFSQHRFVTSRNLFKNRPAINRPVTSFPRHTILRPKFDTIDKSRVKYKVRPKPLIMKHTDSMFGDHFDTVKQNKPSNSDKNIVPRIGLISRKSRINNVIDRPIWRTTEKPKFFKDRIDSIRNYLYNSEFVKATEKTVLLDHMVGKRVSSEEGRPAAPRRQDGDGSTTQEPNTPRPRRTIFFLSPTLSYNQYF